MNDHIDNNVHINQLWHFKEYYKTNRHILNRVTQQ